MHFETLAVINACCHLLPLQKNAGMPSPRHSQTMLAGNDKPNETDEFLLKPMFQNPGIVNSITLTRTPPCEGATI